MVKDGYNVAALKHIHHEFTIDTEGKDTHRMATKGAKIVASISPNEVAILYKKIDNWEENIDRVLATFEREGIDITVAEGFHNILGRRREVFKILTAKNSEEAEYFLATTTPPIIALVKRPEATPGPVTSNIPVFDFPPDNRLYLTLRRVIDG